MELRETNSDFAATLIILGEIDNSVAKAFEKLCTVSTATVATILF